MTDSQNTADRIADSVHFTETAFVDWTQGAGWQDRYEEDQPLRWMVLNQDLPAGTIPTSGSPLITKPATTYNNASPANWQSAANSGLGGYYADTSTNYTVTEGTGLRNWSSGSWLPCRSVGTQNGFVWEPVFPSQISRADYYFSYSASSLSLSPVTFDYSVFGASGSMIQINQAGLYFGILTCTGSAIGLGTDYGTNGGYFQLYTPWSVGLTYSSGFSYNNFFGSGIGFGYGCAGTVPLVCTGVSTTSGDTLPTVNPYSYSYDSGGFAGTFNITQTAIAAAPQTISISCNTSTPVALSAGYVLIQGNITLLQIGQPRV